MTMFNFNAISENNFTSNTTRSLKPYGIYKVSLTNIELKDIQGKKDPSAVYHTIHLEFTGKGDDEGVFQTNIFIPSTEEDNQRPKFTNNGHDYERPSRFENYQYTLMQMVEVINPKGANSIKEAIKAGKVKNMDTFNALIVKALSGKGDVVTNLKLVGRNSNGTVYAQLPNACGLNREGETFPTNIIGDNLFFTPYEEQQAEAYKQAIPTQMPAEIETPDTKDNDTIDFSGLDL